MIRVDPALIAPQPAPAPAAATAPGSVDARVRIERQLAMLDRLAQIGMEVAEACGRQAQDMLTGAPADAADAAEAAPPAARPDPGLVFARVARAVRLTIALQSRLMKDLAALDRAAAFAEADRRRGRRAYLGGLVEEAARTLVEARRKAEGRYRGEEDAAEDEIEQMAEAAYERLTDAEDGDLDGLSFDEAVAAVCRDLGLSPDRAARLKSVMAAPSGDAGGDLSPAAGLPAPPGPSPALPAAAPWAPARPPP